MEVVSVLVLLFIVAGLAAMFIGVILVVRFVVNAMQGGGAPAVQPAAQKADGGMTAEDEGNVHSGPYGYSPNTAYPETQYGSLFNPDAEWAHEEEM